MTNSEATFYNSIRKCSLKLLLTHPRNDESVIRYHHLDLDERGYKRLAHVLYDMLSEKNVYEVHKNIDKVLACPSWDQQTYRAAMLSELSKKKEPKTENSRTDYTTFCGPMESFTQRGGCLRLHFFLNWFEPFYKLKVPSENPRAIHLFVFELFHCFSDTSIECLQSEVNYWHRYLDHIEYMDKLKFDLDRKRVTQTEYERESQRSRDSLFIGNKGQLFCEGAKDAKPSEVQKERTSIKSRKTTKERKERQPRKGAKSPKTPKTPKKSPNVETECGKVSTATKQTKI